jgi:hypothetical protein
VGAPPRTSLTLASSATCFIRRLAKESAVPRVLEVNIIINKFVKVITVDCTTACNLEACVLKRSINLILLEYIIRIQL